MAARDLFWRILQAMAAGAVALDLEGIGDHVYLQIVPDDTAGYSVTKRAVVDLLFPAVLFVLDTDGEVRAPEDTGTKGWTFPVRCWVADRNPKERHDRLPIYLGARKALMDLFDERPLLAALDDGSLAAEMVAEVVRMQVRPGLIFDPRLPNYQHLLSGLLIDVETEESR